ncbi:HAMP domain-containing histidine kinase [Mediterraneibacter sp. gm002]|nr:MULTISPECIES: sensor histidine kinase [Clostridia]RKQ27514.1 sensor histidine kinase [Ruminococcus sp. B05]TAP31671.1 HAMP domain-containing histidine kinase [Mediterraneibacter sp. gm002]
MKMFLKSKQNELLCYIGSMSLFVTVLFLYDVRTDAIQYGLLLSTVLFLINLTLQFFKFQKRLSEQDYQNIIKNLKEQNGELKSQERIFKQEMSDYYSMWVHQIKTPIAAMHVLQQTLEEEYPEQKYIKEIKLELFKIEQYVEMVLTYLRMGEMSGDLKFEKYSLDAIVRQVIRKYSQMFILRKIHLQYVKTSQCIVTDEKWLQFVLEQVLSNALKYTKDGGMIFIYTEEKENKKCLVIEDSGIGIQAEDLPRVFEKGFTGYNGRADKKSTGIGLYMCKKIMERLNHQIWIESEVDKGTKVYLDLAREEWTIE